MPQIKLVLPAATFDLARSLAGLLGELDAPAPLAVTQFEAGSRAWLVEAYYDTAPDLAHIAAALAGLGLALPPDARLEAVPDENWVALSQAALPPVEAGRFVIHGSHDRARVGFRPTAIEIDAGEAFGTAHHATTQGCLAALDRVQRRRPRARVLDLGCGSGVLAIAAARLLPHAVVLASDIDPEAVRVAAANARVNRAASRIAFVTAVGFDHIRLRGAARFDLIVANILAAPLIALAPTMRRALAPAGAAILSGLLIEQAPQVTAAYRASGFRLDCHDRRAGWSTLTLTRR